VEGYSRNLFPHLSLPQSRGSPTGLGSRRGSQISTGRRRP
jgi:hypothetical protein